MVSIYCGCITAILFSAVENKTFLRVQLTWQALMILSPWRVAAAKWCDCHIYPIQRIMSFCSQSTHNHQLMMAPVSFSIHSHVILSFQDTSLNCKMPILSKSVQCWLSILLSLWQDKKKSPVKQIYCGHHRSIEFIVNWSYHFRANELKGNLMQRGMQVFIWWDIQKQECISEIDSATCCIILLWV